MGQLCRPPALASVHPRADRSPLAQIRVPVTLSYLKHRRTWRRLRAAVGGSPGLHSGCHLYRAASQVGGISGMALGLAPTMTSIWFWIDSTPPPPAGTSLSWYLGQDHIFTSLRDMRSAQNRTGPILDFAGQVQQWYGSFVHKLLSVSTPREQVLTQTSSLSVSTGHCRLKVHAPARVRSWVWLRTYFWKPGQVVGARGDRGAFGGELAPSSGARENSTSLSYLRWAAGAESHPGLSLLLTPIKSPHPLYCP